MRTEVAFLRAERSACFFHRMHNKPVWIVPTKNGYVISIIKPNEEELPEGTAAILTEQGKQKEQYEIVTTIYAKPKSPMK